MLSITKVETIPGSIVLDAYRITVSLDNWIAAPVTFRPVGPLRITGVRATGEEMGSGSFALEDTYEMQPGQRTFTTDATSYHGFGSPVTAFKLSGWVGVSNSTPDQAVRHKFCDYKDMEMGPPFQGSWGS